MGLTLETPAGSTEILCLLCLILGNAFFTLAQTGLLEAKKNLLEKRADAGEGGAKCALLLMDEPKYVLATLQIGVTTTAILIGALIGARLSPLATALFDAFLLQQYAEILAFLCSAATVCYLSLTLGAFLPKKIALDRPEAVVIKCAPLLARLTALCRPFVSLFSVSTNFVLLCLGINPYKENTVTEDEVRTLIEQGTEDGTFEKTEQAMVDRIFRLSDQNAYALMTPRTQMLWLDLGDSPEYNLSVVKDNPDVIFPVARDNLDDFVGVVYAKDLLNLALDGKKPDIAACIRTPVFVPKSMQAFKILENFRQSGTHEAIVLDEFGGVVGFITIKDIITEVLGDFAANQGDDPAQITQRDENSWLVDGLLPIEDFKTYFDLDELPDEERDHYQTMGGFITSYLGYLPVATEKFTWNGFTFEIVDMDRVRVDKILVTRQQVKTPAEQLREETGIAS